MDALTHVFLPLTVVYAVRPQLFDRPELLSLGALGLLADGDKFLGHPGLLHSLTTLIPICLGVMAVEYVWRGELQYSALAAAIILSHLVLDVVDGGPVPLLYPLSTAGIGFTYPIQVAFGEGLLGIAFQGSPVALRTTAPQPGFNTYGFLNGFGVASMLTFLAVYVGNQLSSRGDAT